MKPLEFYLTPKQEALFNILCDAYKGEVASFCKKNYILVRGQAPVMLVAHLDTVHHEPVREICKTKSGNILMSPQGIGGDDRCGVYALNAVYEQSNVKPWLLFTCDEEVGGVGAEQFCLKHQGKKLPKELDELKLIIEIDRKGRNDAVYYDCANEEFEKYITDKGFKTQFGSFSDISYVAPELGAAAVNLSSGYYNAHTQHEYINRKHLNKTVQKVIEIVADAAKPDFPRYEYVERVRSFGRFYGYGGWDDGGHTWPPSGLHVPSSEKDIPQIDDDLLKDAPKYLRDEYIALLDYYSKEELDDIRAEYGDQFITMLFETLSESEFGEDYESLHEEGGG